MERNRGRIPEESVHDAGHKAGRFNRSGNLSEENTNVDAGKEAVQKTVQKACKTDILFPENGHDAEAGQADR